MTYYVERPDLPEATSAAEIVSRRRIIQGPSDKFRGISLLKYPWARSFLKQMEANTWSTEEMNFSKDVMQFKQGMLTKGQELCVRRTLARLSNLDAIQLNNLAENINECITAPEIQFCIYRQVWEEQVHVDTYSTIIESLFEDPHEIYDMYRVNPVLKEATDFVTAQANAIKTDGFTPENFVYALVSNIILEGIYFYSGFLDMYVVARSGYLLEVAKAIKLIQRDEVVHLDLFITIFNALRAERPELFTEEVMENCRKLFRAAVELEIAWGSYCIEEGVLGVTPTIHRQFLESICDERTERIGLGKMYGTKNPVTWFYKFSDPNGSEENNFETKITTYSKTPISWDDDED